MSEESYRGRTIAHQTFQDSVCEADRTSQWLGKEQDNVGFTFDLNCLKAVSRIYLRNSYNTYSKDR